MTREVINQVLANLDQTLKTAPAMDASQIDRYLAEMLGQVQLLSNATASSKFMEAAVDTIRTVVHTYPVNSRERTQAFARMYVDFQNICIFLSRQDVGKDRDSIGILRHAASVTQEAVQLIDTTHSDSFRDNILLWAVMMAM